MDLYVIKGNGEDNTTGGQTTLQQHRYNWGNLVPKNQMGWTCIEKKRIMQTERRVLEGNAFERQPRRRPKQRRWKLVKSDMERIGGVRIHY